MTRAAGFDVVEFAAPSEGMNEQYVLGDRAVLVAS